MTKLAAMLLACALPAFAASPAPGPVTVSDADHRFTIAFPAPARQSSIPQLTPGGFLTRHSWSADGDGGKVSYEVSTVDYPLGMKLDVAGFDQLVGAAAMFSDAGYPKVLTVGGWPARETRVQIPFSSHLWQRAIFSGDRLVQVLVMRDSGPFTKADEQVMSSLKLVDLWKKIEDPKAGFSARLPADVTPTTTTTPSPIGPANLKTWQVPREGGQLCYLVGVVTYAADARFDTDRALHGAADKMLETVQGESTGRIEIKLGDVPGLEVRSKLKPRGALAVRLYFRAPHLYQLAVIATEDAIIGPREEAFLASPRLDPLR